MKHIKTFKIYESFDLGREEIIDFLDDFNLVDLKSVETKLVSEFAKELKDHMKFVSYYIKDLFSDNNPERSRHDLITNYLNYKTGTLDHILGRSNEEMLIVTLDYYHPEMVRNSSFNYEAYIQQTLSSRLQRIRDGYDMNVFMYIEGGGLGVINYMSDPIATVKLFIFNAV